MVNRGRKPTAEQIANDIGYVLPPVPNTGGVKPMRLVKGQRVGISVQVQCFAPPCPPMIINRGTVTGNIQKTFPDAKLIDLKEE